MTERWGIAPYFLVRDVVAAANFYRDAFGFSYDRFWAEPPHFCLVRRAGVTVMLAQVADAGVVRPNGSATGDEAWDAYVWVEDADALYAEFKGRGVAIARDICDQPYRCRDFDVLDRDGYRLCFGSDLDG